ncbi:hypothetical protein ACVBEF_09485 [Glaciimonas sp. GG7]
MLKMKKRWLIFIIILSLMFYLIYYKWHEGTPYGEKKYSPNKEFYFQRYQVWTIDESTPIFLFFRYYHAHGYIRAYTAEGKFIGEVFTTRLGEAYVFWMDAYLNVMDGVNHDDEKGSIRLPKRAMKPWY